MRGIGIFESVLVVGVLASSVIADGTPVLGARATTTLTPISIKGNGMESASSGIELLPDKIPAFYQGSDRFYIRGVDYQPGTYPSILSVSPTLTHF